MQKKFYEFKDNNKKAVSYISVVGDNPKKVINLLTSMYEGKRYNFREMTEEEFEKNTLNLDKLVGEINSCSTD